MENGENSTLRHHILYVACPILSDLSSLKELYGWLKIAEAALFHFQIKDLNNSELTLVIVSVKTSVMISLSVSVPN